ncbi:Duplicated hybrid motif [Moorella glycerini]|uniref:Murein hydrolase activator EnvC n=1 Tax=Neomoorella stamsii TaxID=1266720 RepID=A0A9X7P6C1_9FIRM|nr:MULTISPECIES: M23 family metallopeptidase [Moorella]PRR73084.1 Murein hydrolase activator EnvC precursor [Moorella stamsii]CEP67722.1 Duplicated hybrid motif [Moorella glycerini]
MKGSRRDRYFTLMLVPEGRREVYRYLLPAWFFQVAVVMAILLIIALITAAGAVYYLHKRVAELRVIDQINATQAAQIMQLEEQARALQEKIHGIDELDARVRSLLGLGQGGGGRPSEASRGGRLRPREQEQTLNQVRSILNSVARDTPRQEVKLKELAREMEQHLAYLAALPSHWPVRGPISSPFGYRDSPFGRREEFHEGIDIAAAYGAEVQAAGNGRVVFAGWMPVYGRAIIIDHGYGLTSMYGHNSELLVKTGEQVVRGQPIARVGSSGRSTGPHLHFQVKLNDQLQDPLKYLTGGEVAGSAGEKE